MWLLSHLDPGFAIYPYMGPVCVVLYSYYSSVVKYNLLLYGRSQYQTRLQQLSQLGPPADVEFASAAWSNTALSNTGATGLIGICMIGSNSVASEGLPCCLVCAELAARPKCSATILQSAKYAIIQMADIICSYVFAKWLLSFSQLWHCSQLC